MENKEISFQELDIGDEILLGSSKHYVKYIGCDGNRCYLEPLGVNKARFTIHKYNGIDCWSFAVSIINDSISKKLVKKACGIDELFLKVMVILEKVLKH